MDKLILLLLVLLSWLQYSLWLGKNGINSFHHINSDLKLQKEYNSLLKDRNEKLLSRINDLNNSDEILEDPNTE
ncbi:septum formation initiator family protein [Candidatus Erwinia haradaeae]|uniref:Cell division protein FtsB n=1 Tax=Candidatus Erwinia haradaeae TaxID=1922217 RepID=A0A451D4S3_9GAMM|nr:septum formation initiator family protein [Candidatus Erwinia haradaeae]VFP80720.1 Cell division protein FtsB [Candidatus Erwinia haradaeae]